MALVPHTCDLCGFSLPFSMDSADYLGCPKCPRRDCAGTMHARSHPSHECRNNLAHMGDIFGAFDEVLNAKREAKR